MFPWKGLAARFVALPRSGVLEMPFGAEERCFLRARSRKGAAELLTSVVWSCREPRGTGMLAGRLAIGTRGNQDQVRAINN